MKRNPRKVRWTKAFRKAAGKEMTIVSSAPFAPQHRIAKLSLVQGFYNRVRKTKKRSGPLRPRTCANDSEGNEADRRDQETKRTRFLEKQVTLIIFRFAYFYEPNPLFRMAISREKHRAHRNQVKQLELRKTSTRLVEPVSIESPETGKVTEKIQVPRKAKSALVQGEGRTMAMEID
jgi:large subunit ribosomal protein L24e